MCKTKVGATKEWKNGSSSGEEQTSPGGSLDSMMSNIFIKPQDYAPDDFHARSEEIYRVLAENVRDGVAIIQDHKIVYHNNEIEKIFGYSVQIN